MPLIIPASGAKIPAAFSVDNSCRFNGVNGYLTRTLGTPTDIDAWTFSCWFKKCSPAAEQCVFTGRADASNEGLLKWDTNSNGYWYDHQGGMTSEKISDAVYRDPAAWFHLHFIWDSDDGTAEDRQRIYINNVRVTSFSTSTNPSSGQDSVINSAVDHYIGASGQGATMELNGYLAEVCLIDGLALEPTSFGEFDEDSPSIWKPIDPSGLTFGDNGFYLDFKDSSALGNDVSGNNNDWTVNNIDATDQQQDSPTNNFATLNPLQNYYDPAAFTQGNNVITTAGSTSYYSHRTTTLGMTAGKWYAEFLKTGAASHGIIGIASSMPIANNHWVGLATNAYSLYQWDGKIRSGGAVVATGYGTYASDDYIMMALDLDNNKLYFGENGTWSNSGDPTSGATGTGAVSITAAASTEIGAYFFGLGDFDNASGHIWSCNFGSGSFGDTATGATNADDNGIGVFKYDVPTGYLALCTKNLGSDGG